MKIFVFILLILFISYVISFDNYRNEKIISAKYVIRDKIGISGPFRHHGIYVITNKNNKYLLHSTPKSGLVVTDASMSSNWEILRNIKVNGEKTIGETLKAGSGINNKLINFITGGTCIIAAERMEKFLIK